MLRKTLPFIVALCLACTPALAWEAQVVRVTDGDTLVVARTETGKQVRIRLYGIDCPEGRGRTWQPQPYSRVATDFVKKLLPGGTRVAVIDMDRDKYGRTVAGIVKLPDGTVVQEALLAAGLAWVYPKYCPRCEAWTKIQDMARQNRDGLWHDTSPIPPWEWRHGERDE